jgi:acyl dehydratase
MTKALTSDRLVLEPRLCKELGKLLGEGFTEPSPPPMPPLICPVLLMKPQVSGETGFQNLISSTKDCVTIHEYQFFKISKPLKPSSRYRLETKVDREQSSGSAFGFRVNLKNEQNQLCVSAQTTLRNLAPSELFRLSGVTMPKKKKHGVAHWVQANPVTQDQVVRYLELSGDTNPVHHDPKFAMSLGLSKPLIPGMLVAGMVEPFVHMHHAASRISEIRLRFMAPAPIGTAVRFGLQDRGQTRDRVHNRARIFAISSDDTILLVADLLLGKINSFERD